MPVTEATFQRVALEDPEGHWELHQGRLREKPSMSYAHNETITILMLDVGAQLDRSKYLLRMNLGHVKRTDENYYIPDLYIMPRGLPQQVWDPKSGLETYERPTLLVVEVWSPSTGGYDVDAKLPEYRRRGDLEIWRIHPYDRTLTVWRRRPDGEYDEAVFRSGRVALAAVPDVVIDLDALFAH